MQCIVIDDDAVTRRIIGEYIDRTDFLVNIAEFDNAIEGLNFLHSNPGVDLIFLDIRMPGMDGFELLDTLEQQPQVIIISGSDEYAMQAFEFGASDYLLKPIAYPRFYKGVSKTLRWMRPPSNSGELYLKKNSALVRVSYASIVWVESMENYVKIHTETERFTLHFTLKATERHLPEGMFKRIHRSYIVNLQHIQSIEENNVLLLQHGETVTLPIGKAYRENLLGSLNFLLSK